MKMEAFEINIWNEEDGKLVIATRFKYQLKEMR